MRPVRFLSVITAFGFVVLGLVFAPSLLAQDTPTSEPTAIPTDLPTATETLTATPTASATETPMLIPTPTETATPEPTLTPTETPTTFSSETPTASATFEETATLTETATAWETVTETPTASGDVMEGEGWVGLGGRAAVQNGAVMSAQDAGTPHNLEFIEDFNGNNYLYFWQQPGITTVSGLPLDNITTEGYARSSLQAGEPLELQTTVQLGSDPNISYSVTDFNFFVYFNISPSSLAETHEILMVFKDLSGGTIFTTPSCQWVPSKPLPSPLCPNWTWTMPIQNVKTVTIIYRTINPITPSSSGARYTISLDNLKFVTSELVYPPTTPTPSATPTLPPEPYPINGRIAFVDEDSNGDADIYTMSTTTGNRTQLTASNGEDSHPALSPDGGWVAFVNGSYQQGDILVKPATADYTDNSLLRHLTYDSHNDNYPVWSPDASKIAFTSNNRYDPTTETYVSGIFLLNTDGTGTPTLIYEGSAAELSWSHANNQLLFVAYNYDTESDDLYVLDMNNPSAGREMVQAHIGSDRFPVWSPDGSQIAFASQRTADPNQTGQFNIYVMDSACLILPEGCTNAEVEAVTTFTVQDAIHPAWSPDGNEIAFTTYDPFYTDEPYYDYSDTLTFFQIYRRNTGEASAAMNSISTNLNIENWFSSYSILQHVRQVMWGLNSSQITCSATIISGPTNLRSGPSEETIIIGQQYQTYDRVIAIARTETTDWFLLEANDDPINPSGWVKRTYNQNTLLEFDNPNCVDQATFDVYPDDTPAFTPTPTLTLPPTSTPTPTTDPNITPTPLPAGFCQVSSVGAAVGVWFRNGLVGDQYALRQYLVFNAYDVPSHTTTQNLVAQQVVNGAPVANSYSDTLMLEAIAYSDNTDEQWMRMRIVLGDGSEALGYMALRLLVFNPTCNLSLLPGYVPPVQPPPTEYPIRYISRRADLGLGECQDPTNVNLRNANTGLIQSIAVDTVVRLYGTATDTTIQNLVDSNFIQTPPSDAHSLIDWNDGDGFPSTLWWIVSSVLVVDVDCGGVVPNTPTISAPTPTATSVFGIIGSNSAQIYPTLSPTLLPGGQNPPAVAGDKGFHPSPNGSNTLDTIPLNAELCIDSGDCTPNPIYNPSASIPVFAPVAGCLTSHYGDSSVPLSVVDLKINCTNPGNNIPSVVMHLTHVEPLQAFKGSPVTQGQLIGYLCVPNIGSGECSRVRPSDGVTPVVQSHLALTMTGKLYVSSQMSEFDAQPSDFLRLLIGLHDCATSGNYSVPASTTLCPIVRQYFNSN